ncbi:hypothetical protein QWA68_011006 [Fusarium oxysporum]|nr:hypothetical protein QWA68_011006 [Fusarium oxysporum]
MLTSQKTLFLLLPPPITSGEEPYKIPHSDQCPQHFVQAYAKSTVR